MTTAQARTAPGMGGTAPAAAATATSKPAANATAANVSVLVDGVEEFQVRRRDQASKPGSAAATAAATAAGSVAQKADGSDDEGDHEVVSILMGIF